MTVTARASNTVAFLLSHSEAIMADVQQEIDNLSVLLAKKIERIKRIQRDLQRSSSVLAPPNSVSVHSSSCLLLSHLTFETLEWKGYYR